MSEPMRRKMTDQRLHEIAEQANLRQAVLSQVPSRFDERVKECNDQIGELVDTVLALRFEANHIRAELAEARKDTARLDWMADNSACFDRIVYGFVLEPEITPTLRDAIDAEADKEATWLTAPPE